MVAADGASRRGPDGVPSTTHRGGELLAGRAVGARVIPYGGGTSVVGGVTPAADGAPWLTLSLARLAGLRTLDAAGLLATFGAGTAGPDVEAALRARGLTLGHYPQSWELSTVGGWLSGGSSGSTRPYDASRRSSPGDVEARGS